MGFNPFASVDNYPGMLNKIATFTFVEGCLATLLLRHEYKPFDQLLAPLTISIPVGAVALPLGTLLPAFAFALLARIFKLHDRISDVLFIRHHFDICHVLLPLALLAGTQLRSEQLRTIKKQRKDLMYKVFYKYASSSPGKAQIESHYITMALDQWCWYWVVLEASFMAFVLGILFLRTGRYFPAAIFLACVLASVGILQIVGKYCADYALQELEQIVVDMDRRCAIAGEFSAL